MTDGIRIQQALKVDMFPQTAQARKRIWICFRKQENIKDIQPIVSCHVETVVLMSRKKA